nr:AAA domain-containing protein [Actinomyces bowdenii]
MPPTAVASAAARDSEEGGAREEDSILTQCLAGGVRRHRLTWHYRSTVESLIAFSNEHYYDGALHSFPSPLGMEAGPDDSPDGHGISMRRVKGHYIRAEERYKYPRARPGTNPQEAWEIVMEVIRRFEASPERAPSLGIVTFNLEQRDLIEQRLRAEGPPRVVEALDDPDGLLLKNLENVQGEERDTILFSVTYSANSRGELPLAFGPLSRAGGERRLNVAITRARRQIIVFASFDPEDLHAERSAHQGIKDLRAYLEQARAGGAPPSFFAAATPARAQVDWHRHEIAEELRRAGLEVRTGVGQSSFTIDLVLSGPWRPDRPRVAVLLDGPQWSGRMSVTDRDLLPVDVLERMGWPRVERIWAPEWVQDRKAVIDRMIEAVGGLPSAPVPPGAGACGGGRGSAAPGGPAGAGAASAPTPSEAPGAAPAADAAADTATDAAAPAGGPGGSAGAGAAAVPPGPAAQEEPAAASEGRRAPSATRAPEYTPWRRTQVLPREILDRAAGEAHPDPEARAEVVRVARQICAVESPLAFHRLAVHICRAFGLTRTVASREQGLRRALGSAFAYIDQEDFVWVSMASAGEPVRYRRNALDHVEGIEQIHPRELVSLLSEIRSASPAWISKEDLFRKALDRLSRKRRRLTERVWTAMDAALEAAERDAAPGP